jgi:hypothetical protein
MANDAAILSSGRAPAANGVLCVCGQSTRAARDASKVLIVFLTSTAVKLSLTENGFEMALGPATGALQLTRQYMRGEQAQAHWTYGRIGVPELVLAIEGSSSHVPLTLDRLAPLRNGHGVS